MKFKKIVFLCGARDFHAMDWYRSGQEQLDENQIGILTDLITGEGFKKIISDDEPIDKLLILDKFLFKNQSRLGNLWRNILKFLVLPIQVILLKKYARKNPNVLFYAHSMYYLWLADLAGVDFIGTPQGSDILVKPFRSRIYRSLSVKALRSAKLVTVDSEKMRDKCIELSNVTPFIVQNGIDLKSIQEYKAKNSMTSRDKILSIRGFTELYRIKEILESRGDVGLPLTFIYPFHDDEYKNTCIPFLRSEDEDYGRVTRDKMYTLLGKSKLVVSIPSSDSSPRSVYEAIFCGSIVVITYHPYYDILPQGMKDRIILTDLDDKEWFKKAVVKAELLGKEDFVPSEEALEMFDQRKCFNKILNLINK